jgi:hypothetical protein
MQPGSSDIGPEDAVSTGWVRDPGHSLERLAPLIHELIAWDLVYRSSSGSYQLREDIRKHLEDMSESSVSPTPQVFIGRKCEVCGSLRVTRLIEGVRTCAVCSGSSNRVA